MSAVTRFVAASILVFGSSAYPAEKRLSFGKFGTDIPRVSLVRLLANGALLDGKSVSVVGIVRIEHEGYALYLSKEHFLHRINENSVWISFPKEYRAKLKPLNGRYVRIEGVFAAGRKGHFGQWAAEVAATAIEEL